MLRFVIENKDSMVQDTENWDNIFERLNVTTLVMKVVLFNDFQLEESQQLLNTLTRILLENMRIVGELHMSEKLDLSTITDFQAQIFQKHKNFVQYITDDIKNESKYDHENFNIMEAVSIKFEELYGDIDFFALVGAQRNQKLEKSEKKLGKIEGVKSAESLIADDQKNLTEDVFEPKKTEEFANKNDFEDPFDVKFLVLKKYFLFFVIIVENKKIKIKLF